jgi:hypothetical protein
MPLRKSVRRERRSFRPLRLEPLEQLMLPGFLAPLAFDAGSAPSSVAVADFNGDGIKDLAVANLGSANVSVLLGNGDGTFQDAVNYAAGTEPISVAVGDFNGDTIPDLAVANWLSGTVSILLGNGNGTFQGGRSFAASYRLYSVAVGDFNGDGIPDFAVVGNDDFGRGTVSVGLGNGDGTFIVFSFVTVRDLPSSVAVGDFNGDTIPDLAVVDRSGVVQVLLGNGDGSFQDQREWGAGGMDPSSGVVGDFNGDGIPDLAVAGLRSGISDGFVTVLLGTGDGGFRYAAGAAAGYNPQSVAVGDFNGDGIPDLTVANYSISHGTPSVSVLLGNGDGSFQPAMTYDAGTHPFSVAVGDFNGDGSDDLAVANNLGSNEVSILLNDNAWTDPRPGGQPPGRGRAVEPSAAPVPAIPSAADVLAADVGTAVLGSPGAVTKPVPGPSPLRIGVDAEPDSAAAAPEPRGAAPPVASVGAAFHGDPPAEALLDRLFAESTSGWGGDPVAEQPWWSAL